MWFRIGDLEAVFVGEDFFEDHAVRLNKLKLVDYKIEAVTNYLERLSKRGEKDEALLIYSPYTYFLACHGSGSPYSHALRYRIKDYVQSAISGDDLLLLYFAGKTPQEVFVESISDLVKNNHLRFLIEGWEVPVKDQAPSVAYPFLLYGRYFEEFPERYLSDNRFKPPKGAVNYPDKVEKASSFVYDMYAMKGLYRISPEVFSGFITVAGRGVYAVFVPKPHILFNWRSADAFIELGAFFLALLQAYKDVKHKINREKNKGLIESLIVEGLLKQKEKYRADQYLIGVSITGRGEKEVGGHIVDSGLMSVNLLVRNWQHEKYEKYEENGDDKGLNLFQSIQDKEKTILEALMLTKKFYEEIVEEYMSAKKTNMWPPYTGWHVYREGREMKIEPQKEYMKDLSIFNPEEDALLKFYAGLSGFLSADWTMLIQYYERMLRYHAKKVSKYIGRGERESASTILELLLPYGVAGSPGLVMEDSYNRAITGITAPVHGNVLFPAYSHAPVGVVYGYNRMLEEEVESRVKSEEYYDFHLEAASVVWEKVLKIAEGMGFSKEELKKYELNVKPVPEVGQEPRS